MTLDLIKSSLLIEGYKYAGHTLGVLNTHIFNSAVTDQIAAFGEFDLLVIAKIDDKMSRIDLYNKAEL